MTPHSTPLSLMVCLGATLFAITSACRTPPKDGTLSDDPAEESSDGLGVDTSDTGDTGDPAGDSGMGSGDDSGSGDGEADGSDTGGSGGDDSSSADDGGGEGGSGDSGAGDGSGDGEDGGDGGSGEDGGTSGEDGGDTGEEPEELCNGIDDDGDGLIDEDACPDVVVTDPDTGRAYLMVETAMMWFDAAAYCESYGYKLATVDDDDENQFIWELIYDGEDGVHTVNAHTWIGLHEDVGDTWAWHDGTATGAYDASSGTVVTDDYGTVYFGQAMAFGDEDDATWFEAPQTWYHHAVCESP